MILLELNARMSVRVLELAAVRKFCYCYYVIGKMTAAKNVAQRKRKQQTTDRGEGPGEGHRSDNAPV